MSKSHLVRHYSFYMWCYITEKQLDKGNGCGGLGRGRGGGGGTGRGGHHNVTDRGGHHSSAGKEEQHSAVNDKQYSYCIIVHNHNYN